MVKPQPHLYILCRSCNHPCEAHTWVHLHGNYRCIACAASKPGGGFCAADFPPKWYAVTDNSEGSSSASAYEMQSGLEGLEVSE